MPNTPTQPEVISMRIPSRLDLLSVLDSVATALCDRMKFDVDTASQVTMSVIEAGTNAIQHGHRKNPSLPVDIQFSLYPDRLEVDVHDSGTGFQLDLVQADVTTPEHLFDARGRGIFIMRACMDSVDFQFSPNGTVCHLVKLRPAAQAAG